MKRKIILTLITLLILGLTWFLFIKKYDYKINFTVKTSPGTVYSKIFELENWDISKLGKDIKVIGKTAFSSVDQEVTLKDSIYRFHWDINPINDSVTKVSVQILDTKNSLKQRLLLLFGKSAFIINSTERIRNFKEALERHTETFRVQVIGKSEKPAFQAVIYITFETDLSGKAKEMIKNVYYLTQYMRDYHIKKTGNPFLNITHWDIQNNKITVEFCFPVEKLDSYPADRMVKIKRHIKAQPALKAVYHGNYRYSDRAWFALQNYAKRHDYDVQDRIFEIYYNNPHNYEKELTWKADVFMILKR